MTSARLVRVWEVCQLTGLSRSSLYRQIAAGGFVPRIRVSQRVIAFEEAAVLAWIATRERI
jgi:prophage regulatory protein